MAFFFSYVLIDGRRITPTSQTRRKHAGSSLVKVLHDGAVLYGVVLNIFRHDQPGVDDDTLWAEMNWMKPVDECPLENNIWADLCVTSLVFNCVRC